MSARRSSTVMRSSSTRHTAAVVPVPFPGTGAPVMSSSRKRCSVPSSLRARSVVAAALLALPLSACATGVQATPDAGVIQNPPVSPEDAEEQEELLEDQAGDRADDDQGLEEDPESGFSQEVLAGLVGQQVDLAAEVTRVVGPNAFTLGGREVGEEPVLVVVAEAPVGLAIGDVAQVSGTVVELDVVAAEEALGIDLHEDAEEFEGDAAIQASSVAVGGGSAQ